MSGLVANDLSGLDLATGIAEPSQADIAITRELRVVLETINVRVLDHLIVGSSQVVSLAERGLM